MTTLTTINLHKYLYTQLLPSTQRAWSLIMNLRSTAQHSSWPPSVIAIWNAPLLSVLSVLIWLITPRDLLLAAGEERCRTPSDPPHVISACTAHLHVLIGREYQQMCVLRTVFIQRELLCSLLFFTYFLLSHTLCIDTWELPLSISLRSNRMEAAERSRSVTHHLLLPHSSSATAVKYNMPRCL